jgi:hypothetical protein
MLPGFRVRSVLLELQSSPGATMSNDRGTVRSVCDSRLKFLQECQYTQLSYLLEAAVGGQREDAAQRHRKAGVLAKLNPSSEGVCERDVQAPQARSSPGM